MDARQSLKKNRVRRSLPVPLLTVLSAALMLLSMACQSALTAGPAPSKAVSNPAPPADPSRPIKDKWAVVIGIDKFKDPGIPQLQYASKDAADFAGFLTEKGNFARDHVLLLSNEKASRDNIRDAIGGNWLPRRAAEDDLVVIFASTHGSPKEIDVAGENFLVAYDTDPQNLYVTGIRFADLAPEIKNRTGCDRVVLLLDACNSGAANVGGKGLTRSANFDVSALAGEGQVVISSSSADQRSFESKRYDNGVFTRQLIAALQSRGSKTNLKEAFGFLKEQVEDEVRFDRKLTQTPIMRSKWTGADLVLTAIPARPRHVEPAAETLKPESPDSGETYKRAKELFEAKKYGDAVPLLTQAASGGNALSQNLLGVCYSNGFGVEKDNGRALELFQKAAEQGLARAQRNVGSAYQTGRGVPKNYSKALEWYQKAAEQKDKESCCGLGVLYRMGWGVPKDYSKAIEWFQKSADQLPRAQFNLGFMNEQGLGVPQNYARAFELYQKAADQGDVDAEFSLGKLLEFGRGTQANPSKAVEWYQKAADKKDAESQLRLGLAYARGMGVPQNDAMAVEWYQKSADQGNAGGQYNLGRMYKHGWGVKKDPSRALELYRQSAAQGYAEAKEALSGREQ